MRRVLFILVLAGSAGAHAAPKPRPTPPRPRVVEAVVFKDGHVLVRQELTATPASGEVTLEAPPSPVYGTFHPYARTPGVRVTATTASTTATTEQRPVSTIRGLLRVNLGRPVRIVETSGEVVEGTLAGEPLPIAPIATTRLGEALLAAQAENVLITTRTGLRVLPLHRIRSLAFPGAYSRMDQVPGTRLRLRLQVEPAGPRPVTVGATYLQKGIRWIPGYQLELAPQGQARAQFQGTVINELADLYETSVRLVIGKPYVFNEDEQDPLTLGSRPGGLSSRFQPDAISGFGGFGGAMGSSSPRFCGEGPDAEAEPAEDLFYLPPVRMTLKRGETRLLPLSTLHLQYADAYTVDIPFVPQEDADRARGLTEEQRRELASLLLEVHAKHQLRVVNTTDQPLTTGPVSVFREGRLLAHSLLPYVPPGNSALVQLGEAPEIQVRHTDSEVRRVDLERKNPAELVYTRVEFAGEVRVRNQSGRTLEVEVTRMVPGNVDTAPQAEVTRLDQSSDRSRRPWTNRLTGSGRLQWKVRLAPGEERTLPYTWHVFRN